jgi:hypothetical protein
MSKKFPDGKSLIDPAGIQASTISPDAGNDVAFYSGTSLLANSSGSTLAGRGQDSSGPVQIAWFASNEGLLFASCERNSLEAGALSESSLQRTDMPEPSSLKRMYRIRLFLIKFNYKNIRSSISKLVFEVVIYCHVTSLGLSGVTHALNTWPKPCM